MTEQAIPADVRRKVKYIDSEGRHAAMIYEDTSTPTSMNIPNEAVEAAAKAAKESFNGKPPRGTRAAIRLALEAAAPHMLVIDDALWHEFQAATATAGTNPSETIRQLVREWVNENKEEAEE